MSSNAERNYLIACSMCKRLLVFHVENKTGLPPSD
jgi:hypothetical protein